MGTLQALGSTGSSRVFASWQKEVRFGCDPYSDGVSAPNIIYDKEKLDCLRSWPLELLDLLF